MYNCVPVGSTCGCTISITGSGPGPPPPPPLTPGTGCRAVAITPKSDSNVCHDADDCGTGKVCIVKASSCDCEDRAITPGTYANGAFDFRGNTQTSYIEQCDHTAGNPTAQCRYTLGDVSNTQYRCNLGTCVALSFGQSYVGDMVVQFMNSQMLQEQCEPPFDFDQPSGMMCGISGVYIVDSDGDGLSNSEEINAVYGFASDPYVFDSDGDTISDGAEVWAGFRPDYFTDINQLGIQNNNAFLNSPQYPSVQNVEQCDRSSLYNNNFCITNFGVTKCSDLNSHCVDKDMSDGAGGGQGGGGGGQDPVHDISSLYS